jgi:catechol 2,3-dioxygenase-like lactoylglutathione lyase family enzyme
MLLHHVELWVPDLTRAERSWGWLLTALGAQPYQAWDHGRSWRDGDLYVVLEQSPDLVDGAHERRRPGLNHLAFHVDHRPLAGLDVTPPEAHGREPVPAHFHPDCDIFRATLARLPEVRRPWRRRIFDESGGYSSPGPFW